LIPSNSVECSSGSCAAALSYGFVYETSLFGCEMMQ
jgi:hypothetical protein